MKDIARRTGLGLATISSYFNGGNVREKNRKKIEEAIEELHYEVNEVARGLKTNATRTVGVVIPELNNVFCAEIITEREDIRHHRLRLPDESGAGAGSGRISQQETCGRDHQYAGGHRGRTPAEIP